MKKRFPSISHWTFKKKLMLFSLFVGTVPLIMLGIVSAYMAGKSVQEETDHNHRIILRQVQHQIDNILRNLDTFSLQIANDPVIKKSMQRGISMNNLETLEAMLEMTESVRQYRSYNGATFHVSLVYNNYDQIYSSDYGIQKASDFLYHELLQREQGHLNRSIIVPPNTYPDQNDYLIMRTVTTTSSVQPIGRVILHINPSILFESFAFADLGNNRKLLVLDTEGKVAISSKPEEIGTLIAPMGDSYHLSSQKSDFNQWTYMALTPLKETTAKSDHIRSLTWIIVGCIVFLWILIAFFGSRRLYNPIQLLFTRLSINDNSNGDLKVLGDYIDNIVHHNTSLQDRWNKQIPQLKDNTLLQLLRGELSEWEYHALADQYSISLSGACYYVCLLEVDNSIAFHQNFKAKDRTLISYALSRLVEDICRDMSSCEIVVPFPGQVVLMLGAEWDDRDTRRKMIDLSDMVRSKVAEHFNFTITAAVSDSISSIDHIPIAYEQTLQFQRYRPLIGYGITITSETVEQPAMLHESIQSFIQRQKAVVASISDKNISQASKHFEKMMEEAPSCFLSSDRIIGLLVFLLGDIEDAVRREGYELSTWLNDDMYRSLYSAQDITEARDWFINKLFPVLQQNLLQREKCLSVKQDELVEQVIVYIHKHFEENLSLQEIAEHFGCSPYYLSRVFKECKHINFVEYLIRYRMEKAKEWLVHTDLSIKDITERLTYTTTQNFTRVFKQITGMPPGNYRNIYRDSYTLE